MKSRPPSLTQALQRALQLDLFSDFPVTQRQRAKPAPDAVQAPLQPPADVAGTTNKRRILLQDHLLDYELQRSKRRSIGFLIDENGLRVTAPRWVTLADIESAIRDKQKWILRKLGERRERALRPLTPAIRWDDGALLPYLGSQITVRIAPAQTSGIVFRHDSGELIVSLPAGAGEQQLKDRVQAWLQGEAKRIFHERLPLFADKLGVRYHSMALSAASTRWGSCTSQGKIRLNWRLIHFSPVIIDYVIAHELAHLREMNHSPRFWATVQSVFPEFELARQQLRRHATSELPTF
ncbi:MAG: M48 family metallopeptidase [Burkholderiales bacterium]|nr:M48 family metallopeptidase [Burkholderiales bacterium]